MHQRSSSLRPPPRRWWVPLGKDERLWVVVVAAWAVAMFFMMLIVWPAIGNEQNAFQTYSIDPATFESKANEYIERHQVGTEGGIPVVEPSTEEVYLLGERFQFKPIIRLRRGETYRFFISSKDVQHGLSIQPDNLNFQVVPGYVTVLELTPEEAGVYELICNEFCGLGHHLMAGRIIVEES